MRFSNTDSSHLPILGLFYYGLCNRGTFNFNNFCSQFRGKFEIAQREMIDQRRSYETSLGTFPKSIFLSLAGYPKIDLSKYVIVTTEKARQTFETKRDTGIQLRPAN